MNDDIEKICPYCKEEINENDSTIKCNICGALHHKECWEQNNGCAKPGCTSSKCTNCGADIKPSQNFCPNCGEKQGVAIQSKENEQNEQVNVATKKNNKKTLITIITVVAVAIVLIIVFSMNSKVDFKNVYNKIGGNTLYCKVSDDAEYLKIDTNPFNIDKSFSSEAYEMIKKANKELGFSETLDMKMSQTRSLDGRLREENDKVVVTWTYHPDQGLEVLYENKR